MKGLPEPAVANAYASVAPPRPVAQRRSQQPLPRPVSPPLSSRIPYEPQPPEMDDDNMTDITRTDDDPVAQAFRTALGPPTDAGDDDEDEDEIVWNPGLVSCLNYRI